MRDIEMTKKAVLVYDNNGWLHQSESDPNEIPYSIAGHSGDAETWVIVPNDHDHYSEIMMYVNMVSQPDDEIWVESPNYDFIEAYQVRHQTITALTQSYDITAEVIEF
jgi:hypothetical protein